MATSYIFDTCAFIDYFKYYSNDNSNIFQFLLDKIESEEVIIIDKVVDELTGNDKFKKKISSKIVQTDFLRKNVDKYFDKEVVYRNEKFNKDFETEKQKFKDEYADLYLIELCKYLKTNTLNDEIYIVTNETSNERHNSNLFLKIPFFYK